MNELLGFIVLSGPLFLVLIFLLVLIVGIIVLRKKVTGTKKRLLGGLSIFGIAFFLLFGDEIIGKMYLDYLCKTKAGVNVNNTIELPVEYWNKNKELNVFNKQGYLNRDFWISKIDSSKGNVERHSSVLSIDKDTSKIIYKENNTLLAEIVTYRFWGGWLRRLFSLHNSAKSCSFIQDKNFTKKTYKKLFVLPSFTN